MLLKLARRFCQFHHSAAEGALGVMTKRTKRGQMFSVENKPVPLFGHFLSICLAKSKPSEELIQLHIRP